MKLTIPAHYNPVLSVRQTQEAIKYIRDTFQHEIWKRDESASYFRPVIRCKNVPD